MPDRYVGTGGAWKAAKESFVGVDGEWRPQRVRLVAHDGRWLETNTAEAPDTSPVGIHSLSYRAGGPLQGDLQVRGYGLTTEFTTEPHTGAFYPLRTNAGDTFENFSSLVARGTEAMIPTVEDGITCYRLDPSKQQFWTTIDAPDESAYDLRGLLAGGVAASDSTWEIGGKYMPKVMPAGDDMAIVWYAEADEVNFICVWYDASGTFYFRYQAGLAAAWQVSLDDAAVLDAWTGWSVRHRIDPATSTRYFTMLLHDGREAETAGPFTYFTPAPGLPIDIGSGKTPPSTVLSSDWCRSDNTAPAFTRVSDVELYWTGTAYRSAVPSAPMAPSTGKYFIEFLNATSYDVHYGLVDSAFNLTGDNIQYGWIINTINGRTWAHTTGGGTNWTSAVPDNAVVGLVYDSDDGTIELFVNGTSRGKPWSTGAITGGVQFSIGGRGQSATGPVRPFSVVMRPKAIDWTNAPAGTLQEMPYQDEAVPGSRVYSDMVLRDVFMRRDNDGAMSDLNRKLVIDPNPILQIKFYPEDGGAPVETNKYILASQPDGEKLIMATPELPNGNYFIRTSYSTGGGESNPRLFTVREQVMRTEPLHIDFAADSVAKVRSEIMAAHKQWGGANGGVSSENVVWNRRTGLMECRGYGDQYTGPVLGVDRVGKPSGMNTRIGGCLVTRDYYGPGSYRVWARTAQRFGVCSALWTFHYEESYPGSTLWTSHVEDGLHYGGTEENGYYTVRNHEIDIEMPSALKLDPLGGENVSFENAKFNTWRGELRNWNAPNNDGYKYDRFGNLDPNWSADNDPSYWSEYEDSFINHGVNVGDGNFHEFRFDWHVGPDARVEFYIDGTLKHTNTGYIPDIPGRFWAGLWFPSANLQWAGRGAPWVQETMLIQTIDIIPFADEAEHVRSFTETYPDDVYRDIKNYIIREE